MANRYFVGTGNRNLADTANWSLTSGGSGGASVPTASDTAFFDSNSGTGTITINAAFSCLNFNAGGLTANLTLSGSVYSINVYGSLVDSPYLLRSFTGTSYLYFKATTTGNTITSNGATAGWNRIYFDGVGGEWINQDDWVHKAGQVVLVNGHMNFNSKTINFGDNSFTTDVGVKIISFGSGKLIVRRFAGNATNFTWNYDTGTLELRPNGLSGDYQIAFNLTLYNLNVIANAQVPAMIWANFPNPITVTNTLTLTGANASNYRLLVASNTIGTPRTITVNGSIVASNVDFRDITLAGTASRDLSAITGGSGDCGGNSGITFTPSQKQYYRHLGGGTCTFKDATKWFSDAGFTTAGRVPLPQDDWDGLAGSFNATTTFQIDCPRIGRSCNLEGVANAVTMQLMNSIEVYGSYVLGENINPSGNYNIVLIGRDVFYINIYGKIIYNIWFNAPNSNYIVLNDFICWSIAILYNSIINFENRLIELRSNSGTAWASNVGIISDTCLCFNPILGGAGNIVFQGGGKSFNKVQFSGNHTGNFDVTGNNTFNEIIIDKGRKVRFTAGTTQNIKKLTAEIDADNPITITSPTAAQHTLNYTGDDIVECDYLNLSYSKATPSEKWYAGDNSVDGGNNTGWLFESAFTPILIEY